MDKIIEVESLTKKFGELVAVDCVSFDVEKGEIFGFLGPNGAGKSTTINMLCTLLKPTSGGAILNGFDVLKEPHAVRRSIGLVFQDPSLDDRLTARENLEFHAMVYNLAPKDMWDRIAEVLRLVDLEDRQNDLVRNFSGGMKRRLEIARGLIHYPKVLFLDEPTLGLDPQTRNHIWQYVHDLKEREEITIFLTTHYMDEAENCGRIAIIDYGRIIALDTPDGLKRQVGGDIITIKTVDNERAAREIKERYGLEVSRDDGSLKFEIVRGEEFIPDLISGLSIEITSINWRKPTLEDVFLKLTGRAIREEDAGPVDRMRMYARTKGRR
ncbi:MAG: ATP-binding cassette domain-containing protein [Actinomycetota bacterium]|nr:ATP-binding cassette domain-containing protein [Actinomycetota bacterium]